VATKELFQNATSKISRTADEASEYVKNAPYRIAASAAEASEYTKDLVS
jgi:hypothetical protein